MTGEPRGKQARKNALLKTAVAVVAAPRATDERASAAQRTRSTPRHELPGTGGGSVNEPTSGAVKFDRIEISNLAPGATEAQLRSLFLAHGALSAFERPLNPDTGRPGAVAYIEMPSGAAAAAVAALNGYEVDGKRLAVSAAPVVGWTPDSDRHALSPTPRRTVLAPSSPAPRGAAAPE